MPVTRAARLGAHTRAVVKARVKRTPFRGQAVDRGGLGATAHPAGIAQRREARSREEDAS
jgi:hypothetical protein